MKLLKFVLFSSKTAGERKRVLREILTETELMMCAKRTAIIAMLMAKYSYYTIGARLHVSASTVQRFHRRLLDGEYRAVVARITALNKKEQWWIDIDSLSRLGLPPIVGRRKMSPVWKKKPRRNNAR